MIAPIKIGNRTIQQSWDTHVTDEEVFLDPTRGTFIVGVAGSGKSILQQHMMSELAAANEPRDIRFVVVDMWGAGLKAFSETFPHTSMVLTPSKIRTEGFPHRLSQQLLRCALTRRVQMAEVGVRNIEQYRDLCRTRGDMQPMPYIVVVTDQLDFPSAQGMLPGHYAYVNMLSSALLARECGFSFICSAYSADSHSARLLRSDFNGICFRTATVSDTLKIIKSSGAQSLRTGSGDALFWDGEVLTSFRAPLDRDN